MMVEPHWTAYVQAFGTPLVALIAGGIASMIAYRQWQTAKEKVVLDLFEKRLEAYNSLSDAIFALIQEGPNNIDAKVLHPLAVGQKQSKFLFGPEVYAYIEHIWMVVIKLRRVTRRQRQEFGTDIDPLLDEEDLLDAEISKFHERLDTLVSPYMRMDAKLAEPNAAGRWLSRLLPRRFRQGRKP